jgi:hypothetical protein
MPLISGDDALAEFRGRLTGRGGLDLIRRHGGRVLFALSVGVGKSALIDAMTVRALEDRFHDLVIVIAPAAG